VHSEAVSCIVTPGLETKYIPDQDHEISLPVSVRLSCARLADYSPVNSELVANDFLVARRRICPHCKVLR